jgi:putative oxidoreductase
VRARGEVIQTIVRLLLGGLFLYAGIVKIADPTQFAGDIAAYRLLPYFGNFLAAAILPWLEILCGTLLIVGFRTGGAAALILVLTSVFMAALASTIVRGLDIDCGCFRHGGQKTSAWTALGRDALLFVAALIVLRNARKKRSREPL